VRPQGSQHVAKEICQSHSASGWLDATGTGT
jgi:hypothetical protein